MLELAEFSRHSRNECLASRPGAPRCPCRYRSSRINQARLINRINAALLLFGVDVKTHNMASSSAFDTSLEVALLTVISDPTEDCGLSHHAPRNRFHIYVGRRAQ